MQGTGLQKLELEEMDGDPWAMGVIKLRVTPAIHHDNVQSVAEEHTPHLCEVHKREHTPGADVTTSVGTIL